MTTEEQVEDFLEHYGVKGMKWGTRKGRSSTSDIKKARGRHNRRISEIHRHAAIGRNTYDPQVKQKAVENIRKLARDPKIKEDLSVGSKITRGEKVASYLMYGPFGGMVTRSESKAQVAQAKAFIKAAKNVKISDFD